MTLPEAVREGLEAALVAKEGSAQVLEDSPLSGGSIHAAARVQTTVGAVFIKWNRGSAARGFGCEARALRALREAAHSDGLLRVPEVLAWRDAEASAGDGAVGWIAMEYLARGRQARGYGARLGQGLAALHRHSSARFGWAEDNFIGSLPQANPRLASWGAFWRDARLAPQLAAARGQGWFAGSEGSWVERVVERAPELLAPTRAEPPSLLHGDLWGGNVYAGPEGVPVLVDPAAYMGHREVDLAMSELFGGFPSDFQEAYQGMWPLLDGYRQVRRPLYQLYYLLVHVNLFGGGYVGGCVQAARSVLAEMR